MKTSNKVLTQQGSPAVLVLFHDYFPVFLRAQIFNFAIRITNVLQTLITTTEGNAELNSVKFSECAQLFFDLCLIIIVIINSVKSRPKCRKQHFKDSTFPNILGVCFQTSPDVSHDHAFLRVYMLLHPREHFQYRVVYGNFIETHYLQQDY